MAGAGKYLQAETNGLKNDSIERNDPIKIPKGIAIVQARKKLTITRKML